MPLFWKSLKLGNPELASALNEKLTAQELQHLNYEVEAYAAQTAANALQKAVTELLHGGSPVDPKMPVDRTRSTGANNAYGFDDSIKQ